MIVACCCSDKLWVGSCGLAICRALCELVVYGLVWILLFPSCSVPENGNLCFLSIPDIFLVSTLLLPTDSALVSPLCLICLHPIPFFQRIWPDIASFLEYFNAEMSKKQGRAGQDKQLSHCWMKNNVSTLAWYWCTYLTSEKKNMYIVFGTLFLISVSQF